MLLEAGSVHGIRSVEYYGIQVQLMANEGYDLRSHFPDVLGIYLIRPVTLLDLRSIFWYTLALIPVLYRYRL
jgi:hypothetical protein